MKDYTFLGLFSGAGGLDLAFELEGFHHALSTDLDEWSVETLRQNRPQWKVLQRDVKTLGAADLPPADVLLAGFPCQGFSLGGNRESNDERNYLYKEAVRIAAIKKPRVVVFENVLNLRMMKEPKSGRPFAELIADDLTKAGYNVRSEIFRVSHYGVPQTRRRFVFIGLRRPFPSGFYWPPKEEETTARKYLGDLAKHPRKKLFNHDPQWGFKSYVHKESGEPYGKEELPVPCRFSRTGSDGHPIRSLDQPFPAIDTATIWGWAQGHIHAQRVHKDRQNDKYTRNPLASVTLWRIRASRLRAFTDREYARLQTFPDSWAFHGGNKRHIHQQIGNAVPVEFGRRIARLIKAILVSQDQNVPFNYTSSTDATHQAPCQLELL